MSDYRYIPLEHSYRGRGYGFRVEVVRDNNGRPHVWIASLPGCTILADTKDVVLHLMRSIAQMLGEEHVGRGLPVLYDIEAETIDAPVIAVSV